MRRLPGHLRRLSIARGVERATQCEALTVAGPLTTERQLSSRAASTSGQTESTPWTFAALPLLGLAAATSASADSTSNDSAPTDGLHFLPLATRQRIFFKYEKRIRDKSTLDKVFEYFSSLEKDQQKFLVPVDLVRAVVPTYPSSESQHTRSGFLDGEQTSGRPQPAGPGTNASFFQNFDVDGDGLISFPEFLLVLTLLSIREKDVQTVFDVVDLDGGGDIDLQEFMEVMELLQAKARVHAAKIGRSHKLSYDSASGLLVSFFGKDGTRRLSLPQFRSFLAQLHDEVVRLEFAHYDSAGRGSITAVDFGHSLVATADVRRVDRLLDKVDAMPPDLAELRVSRTEFEQMYAVLRQLHTLVVALDFMQQVGRTVTRADFSKLTAKLLGVSLSEPTLDIIFHIFGDGRGGGGLDVQAFLEVMMRREIMWARRNDEDLDELTVGVVRRTVACFKRCMSEDQP